MGRLQLAESPVNASAVSEYYINVPTPDGRIVKFREDEFDDLDPQTWHQVMDMLEPFNTQPSMNGLFSKWRENRAVRKDERNERKVAKINARGEGRAATAAAGGGIGNLIKGVAGSIFGGQGQQDLAPVPGDSAARNFSLDISPPQPKWYQNPVVIIGGVAGAAGLLYLLTRK